MIIRIKCLLPFAVYTALGYHGEYDPCRKPHLLPYRLMPFEEGITDIHLAQRYCWFVNSGRIKSLEPLLLRKESKCLYLYIESSGAIKECFDDEWFRAEAIKNHPNAVRACTTDLPSIIDYPEIEDLVFNDTHTLVDWCNITGGIRLPSEERYLARPTLKAFRYIIIYADKILMKRYISAVSAMPWYNPRKWFLQAIERWGRVENAKNTMRYCAYKFFAFR